MGAFLAVLLILEGSQRVLPDHHNPDNHAIQSEATRVHDHDLLARADIYNAQGSV